MSSVEATIGISPPIPEADLLRHNCGLAAYYQRGFNTHGPAPRLASAMAAVNHRGQEGFGVAEISNGAIRSYHNEGLVKDHAATIDSQAGNGRRTTIGHCRYSTSGSIDSDAQQPFSSNQIVLAHNGTITNPLGLLEHIPPEEQTDLVSDTHALFKALSHHPAETLEERMRDILPALEGAFSLTIADPTTQALYLIRDSQGFRPLHFAELEDNSGVIAASESHAVEAFNVPHNGVHSVERGQCLRIDDSGITEIEIGLPKAEDVDPTLCSFENTYIKGATGEAATYRRKCGQRLAEIDIENGFTPQIIAPVPESGRSAAEGYRSAMVQHIIKQGIRQGLSEDEIAEMVDKRMPRDTIMRDRYGGGLPRTFILPNGRKEAVSNKFNFNPDEIAGKSITLVEDSIVRGNTVKFLVQALKDAGATEVHMRVAFGQIENPCYYGVDFTGKNAELIADGRTVEEICEITGLDSLAYLEVQDIEKIHGQVAQEHPNCDYDGGLCTACINGNYPTDIDPDLFIGKASAC